MECSGGEWQPNGVRHRQAPTCRTGGLEYSASKAIDSALQDHRRGVTIDGFSTFGAAHVLSNHRRLGALGRPALVPEQYGNTEGFCAVAGEGSAGLSTRAFAAVHIARKAQNNAFDGSRFDQFSDQDLVPRPFSTSQRLAIRGKAPSRVTCGSADGFRAKIKPEQGASIGQCISEFRGSFADQDASPVAVTKAFTRRPTSAFVFAQNNGIS